MLNIKKILWPTDFSGPSYHALKTAKDLASHFSSQLYIVHIIRPMPPIVEPRKRLPKFNMALYQDELKISAQKSLQEVKEKKLGNISNVHTIVGRGDAAAQIARIVEKERVDLIVLSTHGTSYNRQFFIGSVAEKVVRFVSCPILTVPFVKKEQ